MDTPLTVARRFERATVQNANRWSDDRKVKAECMRLSLWLMTTRAYAECAVLRRGVAADLRAFEECRDG